MTKDIPIIFSAPMVRAILEGRKTQTRRIIGELPPAPAMDAIVHHDNVRHAAPYFDAYCGERKSKENPRGMSRNWCWWTRDDRQCLPTVNVKYAPGDRLWVREAVARIDNSEFGLPSHWQYRADTNGREFPGDWPPETKDDPQRPRWRPSIHMPREASRLTLICEGVKVERLRDISEADAIAEGMVFVDHGLNRYRQQNSGWHSDPVEAAKGPDFCLGSARHAFGNLWERLHGPAAWAANPFVVAPSFRVIKANIDAPEARAA